MTGAKSNILEAIGGTPIIKLQKLARHVRRGDLRQVRVPEPGRFDEGPRRAQHRRRRRAPRAARPGRHDRRGDQRQHRDGPGAGGGAARLPVRVRHARQDVAGEGGGAARVRRARGHLPDRRRARRSAQLLPGRQADGARRRRAPSTRTSTTTPPTRTRTTCRRRRRSGSRPTARSTCSSPAWAPAGPSRGCGRFFKEKKPGFRLVGVDPIGSLYYEYVKTGRMTRPFSLLRRGHRRGLPPRAP